MSTSTWAEGANKPLHPEHRYRYHGSEHETDGNFKANKQPKRPSMKALEPQEPSTKRRKCNLRQPCNTGISQVSTAEFSIE